MVSDSSLVRLEKEDERDHVSKMKRICLENDFVQTMSQIHFFIPSCSACKEKIQFAEGDIIYGDKWYHRTCWKEIEKLAEFIAQ